MKATGVEATDSDSHNNIVWDRRDSMEPERYNSTNTCVSTVEDDAAECSSHDSNETLRSEYVATPMHPVDFYAHSCGDIATPPVEKFVEITKSRNLSSSLDSKPVVTPAIYPPPGNLSPRRTIFMLALLSSTNLCLAMGSSLIAPFFPREALMKGGNVILAGLVMCSYDAVRFMLAPIIGVYVNRTGARFLLIVGPFIVSYCTVLSGLLGMAPAGPCFFILSSATRMMSGLGAIVYGVTTISVQPILFSNYFGFAFGMLRSFSVAGVIIGPAVGGILYSVGGYTLPFWVIGSISIFLTLIQAIITPDLSDVSRLSQQVSDGELDTAQKEPAETGLIDVQCTNTKGGASTARRPQSSIASFFRNRHMLYCFFVNITIGFTVMFFNATISLHILPLVGDISCVGYVMLISGVVEVCASPVAGFLLDRFITPELSSVIYYILSASGLVLAGPSPMLPFLRKSLSLVICGIVVFGTGMAFGYPTPYKMAHRRAVEAGYPSNQHTYGVLTGCLLTCTTFGGFLGPLIGGVLVAAVGFAWASTIVTAFLLTMAVVSFGFDLVIKRKKT